MLASILPGLRELRVPLAAGLLWLTAAWISFGGILLQIETPDVLAQALKLNEWFSGTLMLPLLAFVAYLVGIILAPFNFKSLYRRINGVVLLSATSQAALQNLIRRELLNTRRRGVRFLHLIEQFPDLRQEEHSRSNESERVENADIARAGAGPVETRTADDVITAEKWTWLDSIGATALVSKIVDELDLAEVSLQANSKDIYDKYDRSRAEAEFRNAVALPIGVLSILLSLRWSLETQSWWGLLFLLGVLPTFFLTRSAYSRDIQANDFMVQAILAGISQSPTLKLITDIQVAVSPQNAGAPSDSPAVRAKGSD